MMNRHRKIDAEAHRVVHRVFSSKEAKLKASDEKREFDKCSDVNTRADVNDIVDEVFFIRDYSFLFVSTTDVTQHRASILKSPYFIYTDRKRFIITKLHF